MAYFTWAILILVPVYAVTETDIWYGPIKETVFLWSWMGLIKYRTYEFYDQSEQVTVFGFPWIFILHIPSFYILQQSWKIYKDPEDKIKHAVYGVVAACVQLMLIYMTFHSQDLDVVYSDDVRVFYFPQWLLILLYGVYAGKWFTEESQRVLKIKDEKSEPAQESELGYENSFEPSYGMFIQKDEKKDVVYRYWN